MSSDFDIMSDNKMLSVSVGGLGRRCTRKARVVNSALFVTMESSFNTFLFMFRILCTVHELWVIPSYEECFWPQT